jgi:hypothetical protein
MIDDAMKRSAERDHVISELRDSMSRLQERTETHVRKLDSNDMKMDNLLREVSAAAAILKQAANRSQ